MNVNYDNGYPIFVHKRFKVSPTIPDIQKEVQFSSSVPLYGE